MLHLKDDPVLCFVVDCAKERKWINGVWLFGSRSKEKHSQTSDYDLAVEVDVLKELSWGEFCSELREKNPSLNQLDLLRLDIIEKDFGERIKKEGIKIYERLQNE